MIKPVALAAALALGAAAAHAEGCAPEGGTVLPEVEALNQKILDKDFSGFAEGVKAHIGVDVAQAMNSVAQIFADGFDGCTTIAQRTDTGGMVQNVVVFDGKPGPLFGYWLAMSQNGKFRLLSFNIDTDLDAVMGKLH